MNRNCGRWLQSPTEAVGSVARRSVVRRAYVDGDRGLDRVRLTDFGTFTRVRVRTARGRTATRRVPAPAGGGFSLAQRYLGAARVDGRRGNELFILMAVGDCGHYRGLTWRRGRLKRANAPGGGDWSACGGIPRGGYTRKVRRGKVWVTANFGWPTAGRVNLSFVRYRWARGRWRKTSERSRTVTDRRSQRLSGLNFRFRRR